MVTLSNEEFKKVESLIGFYNQVVRIVSNPEEEADYNTGDSSVFGIGYSMEIEGNTRKVKIQDILLETKTTGEFNKLLKEISIRVKENSKTDYSKEWEELL